MNEPIIDVIVRTGGRPAALLERSVTSLARQSVGPIRILLVRHGPADTASLQALIGGALRSIDVIDAPGANRGCAMSAGLARVTAPRFAFLDDDDYLLEDHFRHLLQAAESVAAPAFAYCDILVLEEGTSEAGSRLFREGPAQPPLGRITDRISVHAFLAERAALDGLPFDRWNLATAEDALLIASLLARSTPVHTPHATCVYVHGRGDASAYLSHPDRAADELTFAREIAPVRAAIEAKFGFAEPMDEAAYLAPFVTAARHATLFAALKKRQAGSGVVALRDVASATPLAENPDLASTRLSLVFQAVAGVTRPGEMDGVEITASENFTFAARMPIEIAISARPVIVAVRVERLAGAFGLGLAGDDHSLVTEARIDPTPVPLELHLAWESPGSPNLVVRRLDALGAERSHIEIGEVAVGFPCDALAESGDKMQAQAALAALASAERIILSPEMATPPQGEAITLTGDPTEIDLGETPWAYAFSMPLPPDATRAVMRVDLGPAASPTFILRVDETWTAVGERLEAPAGARSNKLWLAPLPDGVAVRLVVQAGAAPSGERVTLNGVFLYPLADAL